MLEKLTLKQVLAGGSGLAFAILFATQMAQGQSEARATMAELHEQHARMVQAADATKELAGRSYMANERVLYVLRVLCVNDAKTAEARRLCLADDGLPSR